ncbi:hypothetical protein GLAREA_01221 [Glarea lozoyensis ATCC 20868]|uniref:Uncharacterized protein n=1 Tax=Glarea lozoyensis (strain ATCC 20868 / MF5171) TaxID=1116229 RepID=S3CJC6_GLAL2|nr:uncharacterized protein GLAREA_01221 [Glarea lozoyensis ATCC 20868]EPE25309.1 hypothetical protein GLAREA_01221 [Glarea lozoyensis ATCC 20868]
MTLCGRRPEGFGPSSSLSHPLPTSCFTDTMIIPLPTYILVVLLPLLLILAHLSPIRPSNYAHAKTPRTCASKTAQIIYYIAILIVALMSLLEIIRLATISYSVALLPLLYPAIILGAYLHWSNGIHGRVRGWRWVNSVVIWGGGAVVNVVKIAGLAKEKGVQGRGGYPLSDQVTDVGVVVGVYVFLVGMEGWFGWVESKRAQGGKERESLGSLVEVEGVVGK